MTPVRIHSGRFYRFGLLVDSEGGKTRVIENRACKMVKVSTVTPSDVSPTRRMVNSRRLLEIIQSNARRYGCTKEAGTLLGVKEEEE